MSASGFISGNYKKKLADLLARSRARLPLTNMKWFALLVGSMLLLGSCSSQPPGSKVTPQPPVNKPQQSKEPVRGIWLATVSRLDWPPISSVNISSPAVRISQQQKALTDKLDNLKRLGINTVFSR
ncbi:lipoYddW domain protein [Shigella flexneri 1235-66]|nr:lipoYddW domain protein [Shigella flexneri 1235-66]